MCNIASKPCDRDILFGKGGRSNHHEGNIRYNKLIAANKVRYFILKTNEDKGLFLRAIQDKLCGEEGRKFVELDTKSGEWNEASTQRIREKIRTALCDSKLKNALKIGPNVFWEGPVDVDLCDKDWWYGVSKKEDDIWSCRSLLNGDDSDVLKDATELQKG